MAAIVERRRGPRNLYPNHVAPEIEEKILEHAISYATYGAQRVGNELQLQDVNVSSPVLLRDRSHDLVHRAGLRGRTLVQALIEAIRIDELLPLVLDHPEEDTPDAAREIGPQGPRCRGIACKSRDSRIRIKKLRSYPSLLPERTRTCPSTTQPPL